MLEDTDIEKMEAKHNELSEQLRELRGLEYQYDILTKQIQAYKLWSHRLRPKTLLVATTEFMELPHIQRYGLNKFRLGCVMELICMTSTDLCMVRIKDGRFDTSSIPVEVVHRMSDEYKKRYQKSHIRIQPNIDI